LRNWAWREGAKEWRRRDGGNKLEEGLQADGGSCGGVSDPAVSIASPNPVPQRTLPLELPGRQVRWAASPTISQVRWAACLLGTLRAGGRGQGGQAGVS
jgi:hypothetical protein